MGGCPRCGAGLSSVRSTWELARNANVNVCLGPTELKPPRVGDGGGTAICFNKALQETLKHALV